MKLKCRSCGEKEAVLMSKAEMKAGAKGFVSEAVFRKVLDMIDDWTSQKYIVCKACGHYEEQR